MNALKLLTEDHERVKGLLEDIDSTGEDDVRERQSLFDQIRSEMELHESIEEEIFYPALKAHPNARELVLEGYEEHHVVDRLMGELMQLPLDDETWTAKLTVMKENIEHHIEEEEGEMFDKARSAFDASELEQLGARMRERKQALRSA